MAKIKFVEKTFAHPIPAVDIVIFTIEQEKLKVLLIKMKKVPYEKCWAAPGGLVRTEESVDLAAKRSLFDKTGVKDIFLEQLYTFGRVDRDPFGRVISVAYYALIPSKGIKLKTTEEYSRVEWFDIKNLPDLAYDHKEIISLAIKRLQAKLEYTNIICNLLPKEFTISELQKVYEIILNRKLDKRNFQKKIHSLGMIKKIDKKTTGDAYRPAALYTFIEKKQKIIQIL
ncbi:MAG: NUDIX domain-containing protein [Patescibacteria group bacterium]|nr:NUDIX domain-containing protein [Patescibacteria group bacterium]